jgi:hypothetical protein
MEFNIEISIDCLDSLFRRGTGEVSCTSEHGICKVHNLDIKLGLTEAINLIYFTTKRKIVNKLTARADANSGRQPAAVHITADAMA